MSKGHQRRPTEISLEEANLKWDVTFANTELERQVAIERLEKYYEKRKTAYIEKRIN